MNTFAVVVAGSLLAATGAKAGFFDAVPDMKLRETEPLMAASHIQPVVFAPSSGGGTGDSYYVFGVGQVTEIGLEGEAVVTHAIPFDSQSRKLYDSGADKAWVGPDRRLYFGLAGKPARVARFDPATRKMELLGALEGHAILDHFTSPAGTLYLITYPCLLNELDPASGVIRKLGRMTEDGLYPQGGFWVGTNGLIYGTTGPRSPRHVEVDPKTGAKRLLDALPPRPAPAAGSPGAYADPAARYTVKLEAEGTRASVVIAPKGTSAPPRTVTFTCSTVDRDVQAITAGPDGRIYGSGSYREFVFNPKTGAIERPEYHISIYDYVWTNGLLYMCGYPNARLGVLDPARPVETHGRKAIWEMNDKTYNPREIVCLYNIRNTNDASAGGFLAMKRTMSMAIAGDGRLYIGCTGSRQMAGGALAVVDLKTEQTTFVRAPFTTLGIYEVCPIEGGRRLALATAVSPDPLAPGQDPASASIILYDVAKRAVDFEAVPLAGCKIITALAPVPGTTLLAGLGLEGVEPSMEADNHYDGNHTLFFYDWKARKTVNATPLPFQADRNFGRAFVEGPDGALWLCGGGGLARIDPKTLALEPVAKIGTDGNLLFAGKTLYLGGSAGLRSGDITPFLRKTDDQRK